jgi:pimeloyl-ACP methyl ester carboxylesterase
VKVDCVEAGAGPLVMLVHSSMSGARQWTSLTNELKDRFRVRAVNLFGYGSTPAWNGAAPPSLADFAALVEAAVPPDEERIAVVGHSFGGAVAMAAARRLGGRAGRLVLIEPSLFYLLRLAGRHEAFAEISAVAASMRHGPREEAAERFVGYWAGRDAWEATPPERRAAYARMVELVLLEWTVLDGETPADAWAEALPRRTLLLSAADTKRPSREMVELLLRACPRWELARVREGGHLAPLTRPDLVNPIVAAFLDRRPQPSQ